MSILLEQINALELTEIINSAIDQKFSPLISFFNTSISVIISRKVAAEILDVTPVTVNNYVGYGLLKPIYKEGSSQMSYRLSDVLMVKDQLKTIPNLKKS